jgi:predicted SprT family Zn-dependent metalloprotease
MSTTNRKPGWHREPAAAAILLSNRSLDAIALELRISRPRASELRKDLGAPPRARGGSAPGETNATRSYDPTTPSSEYSTLQQAYETLNAELFAGTLPNVLVTLQRKANTAGYFSARRFSGRIGSQGRTGSGETHELALNPDGFDGRTDEEILSTLAHEMAHVWQQTNGKAPTRCYHDREWATTMKAIGLQPSHTGEPGGKETGAKMSHYIIKDGRFSRTAAAIRASGLRLHWQSTPHDRSARKKKAKSKTKYTCDKCLTNAWAKPETHLICGLCKLRMVSTDADDGGGEEDN